MRRGRKKSLILGILLLVMGLGMGYAFLTTTLNIDGITNIDNNMWNVYFDNIQVSEGSVEADLPVIDASKTTITYHVRLSQPGDYYEFSVDAVNDGTIDAMIESITGSINGEQTVPSYLEISISYGDGLAVKPHQLLKAEERETYKGYIKYNPQSASDLFSTPQTFSISYQVTYVQADSQATGIRREVYMLNDNTLIGNVLSNATTTYDNEESAALSLGVPVCIKGKTGATMTDNDVLLEKYIGFQKGDQIYYIKGSNRKVNLRNFATEIVDNYEEIKTTLTEIFGEENCVESNTDYSCEAGGIIASRTRNGQTRVTNTSRIGCIIYETGKSFCGSFFE